MSNQQKRAVVLGGAGFLGSHLCEALLARGDAVVCRRQLHHRLAPQRRASGGRSDFELVEADIVEPFKIAGPVDHVLNFASPASPIDYAQLPIETLRVGSLGTEHGLQLAQEKKARFLQASTSEVYGDPLVHPQAEAYFGNVNPIGPRSCYDEAKRYGEASAWPTPARTDVDVRIVRIFNTYGPRMRLDDGRVVPAFIAQLLRGEDFTDLRATASRPAASATSTTRSAASCRCSTPPRPARSTSATPSR